MVLTNTLTVVRLFVFEAFLFIVCVLGDYFISNANSILGLGTQLSRVLVDSFTHGFVGFLSWAIIIDFSMFGMDMLECSGCMVLAMLVDTDHFIAARSLQLKHALSLSSRPMFHASTLIPMIAVSIYIVSLYLKDPRLKVLTLMFLVAWTSHHIRDSTRRGLWFPPFGSTRALPTTTYMLLTMLIPILFKTVLYYTEILSCDKVGHKWFCYQGNANKIDFV